MINNKHVKYWKWLILNEIWMAKSMLVTDVGDNFEMMSTDSLDWKSHQMNDSATNHWKSDLNDYIDVVDRFFRLRKVTKKWFTNSIT